MFQKFLRFGFYSAVYLICFFYPAQNFATVTEADINNVTAEDSYPGTDQTSPPEETTETATWDGTVIWNGVKFEGKYPNSVADCALGRVNTQYGALQSYNTNIATDADKGEVSATHKVKYGHGITEAYPYKYTVYKTHVMANDAYLRFWHGSVVIDKNGCDDFGGCDEAQTVTLSLDDGFGKSMPSSFFKGKQAFVLLRGVDMSYGSSVDYVKKFQDAEFVTYLDSTDVPDDGTLTVNVETNFNGSVVADYDAKVYFVIGVFDGKKVSVNTYEVKDKDFSCGTDGFCSDTFSEDITAPHSSTDITSTQVTGGTAVPMFVGIKEWGFNNYANTASEFKRIRAGARLSSWDADSGDADIFAFGEVFKDDCDLVNDGKKHWEANQLTVRVISCASTEVCQAVYSTESGEEVAWTQKVWDAIKSGFMTAVAAVVEAVEDSVDFIKDTVEKGVDFVFSLGDTDYPTREVLVVLNAGESEIALTAPIANGTIDAVYDTYGIPTVTKEFEHFDDQDEVDAHVEDYIMQPYDVRWKLKQVGINGPIAIPPLHRFYVLKFSGITESERDQIIEDLSAAPKIEHVSANYVAKLNASKDDDLYAGNLVWFNPHLQTWWPIGDILGLVGLSLINPEYVSDAMGLLYITDGASQSRSKRYSYNAALATTHFQFPGRPAFPKTTCKYLTSPTTLTAKTLQQALPTHWALLSTVAGSPTLLGSINTGAVVTSGSTNTSTSTTTPTATTVTTTTVAKPTAQTLTAATPVYPCVDKEIIVKYEADVTEAQKLADESLLGLTRLKHFKITDAYHYSLPSGTSIPAALTKLQTNPNVYYAEPNVTHRAATLCSDPNCADQWHHEYLDPADGKESGLRTPEAWDLSIGSNEVIVGVIDTGINMALDDFFHDSFSLTSLYELQSNYTDSNYFFNMVEFNGFAANLFAYDPDHNGLNGDFHGWNFYINDPDVEDTCDHGNAISSLIGAVGDNGRGTAGAAWRVKILPLKVAYCSGGTMASQAGWYDDDIVSAIDYAVSMGAKIINMSFESNAFSQSVYDTIKKYSSVLFVTSAGNTAQNNDTVPHYPSNYDAANVIAVSAHGKTGTLAPFSNFGLTTVDISAPGQSVVASKWVGTQISTTGTYDGTSFSTPLVSGTAALMLSHCPSLTPTQIKDMIIESANPNGGGTNVAWGVLDTRAALDQCVTEGYSEDQGEADEPPCPCCEVAAENETEEACTAANYTWQNEICVCEGNTAADLAGETGGAPCSLTQAGTVTAESFALRAAVWMILSAGFAALLLVRALGGRRRE